MKVSKVRGIAKLLARVREMDTGPDRMEIEADDQLPFVQLGNWVALSGVSPQAMSLYWFLAMHLNKTRGDRYVWPTTDILAHLLGYSRGDKITKFMRELIDIGAVIVIRIPDGDGPQMRNVYRIRRSAPASYQGLMSVDDFYDHVQEAYETEVEEENAGQSTPPETGEDKSAGQTVPAQTGGDGDPATPETGGDSKSAGQTVSPETGGDVEPQTGGYVTPRAGAVTTRSLNKKKERTNKTGCSGRRPSTGSSARTTPSAEQPAISPLSPNLHEGIAAVARICPALWNGLKPSQRGVASSAVKEFMAAAGLTAEEAADVIALRWSETPDVREPIAWLRGRGVRIDVPVPDHVRAEVHSQRGYARWQARRAMPDATVPEQQRAADKAVHALRQAQQAHMMKHSTPVAKWRCTGCGVPKTSERPESGLCGECREPDPAEVCGAWVAEDDARRASQLDT